MCYNAAPSGIYICGKEVLAHFSDNYDYQDFSKDYLTNEVYNVDFGYAYFNDAYYACCITVRARRGDEE